MKVETLLSAITPEIYERLCFAVETGRWPDGKPLTPAQKEQTLQAVMLYQSKHNRAAEHMTVAAGGDICIKSKSELKRQFSHKSEDEIFRVQPASPENN
ncbi:YeaC family protein [Thaumasiovibrio sp. DFM-14]|uniref:YeaC family protein n=1 Tax=Thaumasiovibrio sp. DFM-14 TaxID=3384792 RepID=UPI0039A222EC